MRPARKTKPVPAFVARRRARESRAKYRALLEAYEQARTRHFNRLAEIVNLPVRLLGPDDSSQEATS